VEPPLLCAAYPVTAGGGVECILAVPLCPLVSLLNRRSVGTKRRHPGTSQARSGLDVGPLTDPCCEIALAEAASINCEMSWFPRASSA